MLSILSLSVELIGNICFTCEIYKQDLGKERAVEEDSWVFRQHTDCFLRHVS